MVGEDSVETVKAHDTNSRWMCEKYHRRADTHTHKSIRWIFFNRNTNL